MKVPELIKWFFWFLNQTETIKFTDVVLLGCTESLVTVRL